MIEFNNPKKLAVALTENKELRPVAEDVLRVCHSIMQETDFRPLPSDWPITDNVSLSTITSALIVDSLERVQELMDKEEDDGFEGWLGGSIFVCETEEDLKKIESVSFSFWEIEGRWPNITEDASIGHWDICEYIGTPPTYCLVCLCSNNAGGNMFYVPASLFEAARIEEHIKEYTEVWK